MWQRHGQFFANLTLADDLVGKSSRSVPLKGAYLTDAKADYDRLWGEHVDDRLRSPGLSPTVGGYLKDVYPALATASGKRKSSIDKEASYLKRWTEEIGHLRLNKLRPHHFNKFLTDLASKENDCFDRSINLYLIAIRVVLKAAQRDGHSNPPLPYEGLTWHRVDTKSRQLVTPAEIDRWRGWPAGDQK